MMYRHWIWRLLPIILGLVGLLLLVRVSTVDRGDFLPGRLDLIILLLGLSLTTLISITLVLREIMERLRQHSIEQARKEAFAEHRRFLRRLDHELKNPLTSLRAGLGSLAMTLQSDDSQHRTIITLESEALRLSNLVNDLRKLAELEATALETHPIQLNDFFKEVDDLYRTRIEGASRQFQMILPPQEETQPQLVGDQDLLLLALHNLFDNALKYTQPGDRIRFSAVFDMDDLVIQVQDSGIGIAPVDLPQVWEELYRSQGTDEIPGNGIGLALVRTIVEQHDGLVYITSEPGNGTTVSLRLPLM